MAEDANHEAKAEEPASGDDPAAARWRHYRPGCGCAILGVGLTLALWWAAPIARLHLVRAHLKESVGRSWTDVQQELELAGFRIMDFGPSGRGHDYIAGRKDVDMLSEKIADVSIRLTRIVKCRVHAPVHSVLFVVSEVQVDANGKVTRFLVL